MSEPTPPTPAPVVHWYNNVPVPSAINFVSTLILAALLALHVWFQPAPGPLPVPVPQPTADISLPAQVTSAPGRQAIIEAMTKGVIVHWYIYGDSADVSYHPEVPKATVSAALPGRYQVIAWTAIDGKPTPAAVTTLIVGDVPPGPTPPVPPVPPTPAPVIGKLRVLVVLDKVNVASLPRGQQDIINLPKDLRDYLNSHCGPGEDGKTPEWRFIDKDQDLSGSSAAWRAGQARAQGKTLPYAIVANETATWEGVLPADKGAFLAVMQKYGGP